MNFMDKFNAMADKYLLPFANKLAAQKHLKAIRDAMVSVVPLTIIGGLFLIVASPPVDPLRMKGTNIFYKLLLAWYDWSKKYSYELKLPFYMTMGLVGLFVAIAVGYSLSKEYKLNTLSGSILSGTVFLLLSAPSKAAVVLSSVGNNVNKEAISKLAQQMMSINYLDAKGIFTAIIVGIVSIEIMKFLKDKKITIRMPEGVPPAVSASFEVIIPLLVNIILFYGLSLTIQNATGKIIPEFIMTAMAPTMKAIDSSIGIFIISFISQGLWFLGLHGPAITSPIRLPFMDTHIMINAQNMMNGEALPHVFTQPFWSFIMLIGGSGATLGLVFLLIRSKSSHLKSVGRIGLLPAIFNINEPLTFGLPFVLNPILAIPFIFTQGINAVIAYFLMTLNIVGKPYISIPWTTPAPIGAALGTMDWKVGVLVIALIILDGIIYYPFFKVYERTLLKKEQGE